MNIVQQFLTKNICYIRNVNKADGRYTTFQERGPLGGMLHSVGCAQPSAEVFVRNWDSTAVGEKCVHGFIDANTGTIIQTLPWNYRGMHAGKAAGNNTLLGVEMCESSYIKYRTNDLSKFDVLDLEKAQAHCCIAYNAAVELFAMLAKKYNWDVDKDIVSHNEGGIQGLASGHHDPEHYWTGLRMPYTMDGFRADVKKLVEEQMPKTLYRVQVGAFTNYAYAAQFLAAVQEHFPNAYITTK